MSGMLLSERLLSLHEAVGISRLAEITGLDTLGVPVASAIRPAARSLSVMSGRGSTAEQAKVAATMEAIEAHAAENFRPTCICARYREIADRAVDPHHLPHAPDAQLDAELWWCTATGLLSGAQFMVPFESVHTDWTRPKDPSGLGMDSAGIGAGLSRDQAVRHGLLELVERDALSIATVKAIAAGEEIPVLTPALTPAEIGSATEGLVTRLEAAGVRVHLADLCSDTGIPAIAAYLLDASPNPFRVLPVAMGAAAAPDADEAALRALTEAAQSRLVTISGSRDDLSPAEYERMLDQQAERHLRDRLNEISTTRRPMNTPTGLKNDPAALATAIETVGGYEPLVIDLAHYPLGPDTVHVVRVFAPGLEGSDAQLGVESTPGARASAILEAR